MALAITFDKPLYAPTDKRTMTVSNPDGTRITAVTVTVDGGPAGTASNPYSLEAPLTVTDSSGIAWVKASDDGKTATYTYTPAA